MEKRYYRAKKSPGTGSGSFIVCTVICLVLAFFTSLGLTGMFIYTLRELNMLESDVRVTIDRLNQQQRA